MHLKISCLVTVLLYHHATAACLISEYKCGSGRCVNTNKFCNGYDDCGDKSDEPPYCTPCNRTYFGEVGKTYELEIRRPREDRLPFLCFLNFTSGGNRFGDIIQVTFDAFTVGKFVSHIVDGCPDGFMSIQEKNLPLLGGQWCGSAWGYTVYYSETRSINLTLFLSRLSEQGIGYNFDFKITYKYWMESGSSVRYGNESHKVRRGSLVGGTYCDRILEGCDSHPCKIQSPNYPGIYPRNVTCYYRVEDRHTPSDKRGLVAISQKHPHKMHIKDQFVKYDTSQRSIRVWDQCNVIQDYLTVYDGASTEDPVLVKLCGGDVVPDIISSGPVMLLEFHSSPYDNPFHPVPVTFLPGFELDVQILYVDSWSSMFVRKKNQCDFRIPSADKGPNYGILENPVHSLAPNTTCRYYFQGKKNEIIWISFYEYQAASRDPNAFHLNLECNVRMKIMDGPIFAPNGQLANSTVMGEYCKEDSPKICDHVLLETNATIPYTRPCGPESSYVSSDRELSIEIFLRKGSVLFPIAFRLRYEFVDVSMPGWGTEICQRSFNSTGGKFGKFHSPRNVFLFGRGGSSNMSCSYSFHPRPGERVQLKFTTLRWPSGCHSRTDSTDRYACSHPNPSHILVSEYPWSEEVRLVRHCLCSRIPLPFITSSLAGVRKLQVNFIVVGMNVTQDFRDFYFEGEYHFVNALTPDKTTACAEAKQKKRPTGYSGGIKDWESGICGNQPWLLQPTGSSTNFLYLKAAGYEITDTLECPVAARVVVYSGYDGKGKIICPLSEFHSVDIFSYGWFADTIGNHKGRGLEARSFAVEFSQVPSDYSLTWLKVTKTNAASLYSSLAFAGIDLITCPYKCPELNACISANLWCDGSTHCPSGFDESDINCLRFDVPALYIAVGAGFVLALSGFILCVSWCKYRQHNISGELERDIQGGNRKSEAKNGNELKKNIQDTNEGHALYCKRFDPPDLYYEESETYC